MRRRPFLFAGFTSLCACSEAPPPVWVKLEILDDGVYRLDDQVVADDRLAEALRNKTPEGRKLAVQVVNSRDVPIEAITFAIHCMKEVGAMFALVGNELFWPQGASSPSSPQSAASG